MLFYMIGDGAKDTIHTIIMWYKRTEYVKITCLIVTCLNQYPAFAPAFIEHPEIVPIFTSTLQEFVASQQPRNAKLTFFAHADGCELQLLLGALFRTLGLASAELLNPSRSALPSYLGAHLHALYVAIVHLIDIYADKGYNAQVSCLIGQGPSYQNEVTGLVKFADAIRRSVPAMESSSWPLPGTTAASVSLLSGIVDVLATVQLNRYSHLNTFSTIVAHHRLEVCSNPLASYSHSKGVQPVLNAGSFAKCAACSYAAYCSPACQRTAWSLPACPHRRFCKLAQRLTAAWGPVLSRTNSAGVRDLEQVLSERLVAHDPAFTQEEMRALGDNSDAMTRMRPLDDRMSLLERFVGGERGTG